jgi:hypothetical protein
MYNVRAAQNFMGHNICSMIYGNPSVTLNIIEWYHVHITNRCRTIAIKKEISIVTYVKITYYGPIHF